MTTRRAGFAFSFVVFVLFIIGVLGSVGYAVVDLEADLTSIHQEDLEASAIARAGLARYLGEHLGIPEDTVEYDLGNGTAFVSARFLYEVDPAEERDLYVITAVGEVAGKFPSTPARATVSQYAYLQRQPITRSAVLNASYSSIRFDYYYWVNGYSTFIGTCPEAGEDVRGIAHRGTFTTGSTWGSSTVQGDPAANQQVYSNHAEAMDSLGLRWDVLTDPDFPIEYDQEFPDFWLLSPIEYPVIRTTEDFTATSAHSGQGVLIVPGRLTFSSGFYWRGIILAGEVADFTWTWFWLQGMMFIGLDGTDSSMTWRGLPQLYYEPCHAIGASDALSWFEPVPGSLWEES